MMDSITQPERYLFTFEFPDEDSRNAFFLWFAGGGYADVKLKSDVTVHLDGGNKPVSTVEQIRKKE